MPFTFSPINNDPDHQVAIAEIRRLEAKKMELQKRLNGASDTERLSIKADIRNNQDEIRRALAR
jgi:hypothetical protein